MIRRFVRSVVQNATVSVAESRWPVSLRIDPIIMRAAALEPFEEVEVVSHATADRFTTFVEPATEGSGEVRIHSAERHHVRAGDTISIVSWGLLHDGQTLNHRLKVVELDAKNVVVALTEPWRPGGSP